MRSKQTFLSGSYVILFKVILLSLAVFLLILLIGFIILTFNLNSTGFSSFILSTYVFNQGFLYSSILLLIFTIAGIVLAKFKNNKESMIGFIISSIYSCIVFLICLYLFWIWCVHDFQSCKKWNDLTIEKITFCNKKRIWGLPQATQGTGLSATSPLRQRRMRAFCYYP